MSAGDMAMQWVKLSAATVLIYLSRYTPVLEPDRLYVC